MLKLEAFFAPSWLERVCMPMIVGMDQRTEHAKNWGRNIWKTSKCGSGGERRRSNSQRTKKTLNI